MRFVKEAIDLQWQGVAELGDLPTMAVAGLALTLVHAAKVLPWDRLRARLVDAFGAPRRERRTWRGARLEFQGKFPASVRIGRRRVIVRGTRRIQPKRLQQLVRALNDVPDVREMRLRGVVERFRDPHEDALVGEA